MTAPATERSSWDLTTWDRVRGWRPTARGVAVAALLVLALVVLVLASPRRVGYLDPTAVDPSGSRAVATILGDLGVAVEESRTVRQATADAAGATVLVTAPGLLSADMVEDLVAARPGRVVLIGGEPGQPAVDRLAAGIEPGVPVGADPLPPACELPTALRAGTATLPGPRYDARRASGAAIPCYDAAGAASLVLLESQAETPEVVLLGSGHPLTNEGLDEEGNAALALGLLGAHDSLVWWRPSPADPALGEGQGSLAGLLPAWVLPLVLQIGIASLLVAWWRGRRLGRLVVEPLPVVVRAGETTEGHARLLHAHHARGEAATHLRDAARDRLLQTLALPAGCPAERLVGQVAARAGRDPSAVAVLLYGPEPGDDAALVELGVDLESLIAEVGGA